MAQHQALETQMAQHQAWGPTPFKFLGQRSQATKHVSRNAFMMGKKWALLMAIFERNL